MITPQLLWDFAQTIPILRLLPDYSFLCQSDYSNFQITQHRLDARRIHRIWRLLPCSTTTILWLNYPQTTPQILPAYSQTNKLCLNKGSCALKRRAGSGRQYNICTQHPDYIHGHGYIIWLDQITPKLLSPLSIYYWMNQDTSLFLPLFGRWCWSLRLPFTPRLLPNQSHSLIATWLLQLSE